VLVVVVVVVVIVIAVVVVFVVWVHDHVHCHALFHVWGVVVVVVVVDVVDVGFVVSKGGGGCLVRVGLDRSVGLLELRSIGCCCGRFSRNVRH